MQVIKTFFGKYLNTIYYIGGGKNENRLIISCLILLVEFLNNNDWSVKEFLFTYPGDLHLVYRTIL